MENQEPKEEKQQENNKKKDNKSVTNSQDTKLNVADDKSAINSDKKSADQPKPWVSYAAAVCSGLENHLNNTDQAISLLDSTSSKENAKQQLNNQRQVMSNVLKELNNLTKNAKCVAQKSCLKPTKKKLDTNSEQMEEDKKKKAANSNDLSAEQSTCNTNQQELQIDKSKTDTNQSMESVPKPVRTEQTTIDLTSLSNIVNSEFKCPVCQEIIVDATSLKCSHTFCKVCIDEWLDENGKCPVCRRSIESGNNSRYHVLPIDNFLSLYYLNFMNKEDQTNRARLINEHRSKEVIVINDDQSSAERPSTSQQTGRVSMIIEELHPFRNRNQNRRHRREQRRSERLRRLRRLNQIDGINMSENLSIVDDDLFPTLDPLERAIRESREELLNSEVPNRRHFNDTDSANRTIREDNSQSEDLVIIPVLSNSANSGLFSQIDNSSSNGPPVNMDDENGIDDMPLLVEIDMITVQNPNESLSGTMSTETISRSDFPIRNETAASTGPPSIRNSRISNEISTNRRLSNTRSSNRTSPNRRTSNRVRSSSTSTTNRALRNRSTSNIRSSNRVRSSSTSTTNTPSRNRSTLNRRQTTVRGRRPPIRASRSRMSCRRRSRNSASSVQSLEVQSTRLPDSTQTRPSGQNSRRSNSTRPNSRRSSSRRPNSRRPNSRRSSSRRRGSNRSTSNVSRISSRSRVRSTNTPANTLRRPQSTVSSSGLNRTTRSRYFALKSNASLNERYRSTMRQTTSPSVRRIRERNTLNSTQAERRRARRLRRSGINDFLLDRSD